MGTTLGINQGGTGVVNATAMTAVMNNVVGDSGYGGTKGLVPAPSSGDSAAGKFLAAGGSWKLPSQPVLNFYFTQLDSNLDPFSFEMLPTISSNTTVTSIGGVVDNQMLTYFVTFSSDTPATLYPGVINTYVQAYKNTGSKNVTIYSKLYKVDSDGSNPVLLGTSGNSRYVVNAESPIYDSTQYLVTSTIISSAVTIGVTDRIKVELYAIVTDSGTDPEISFVVENEASRLVLINKENYYLRCTSSSSQLIPNATFPVDVIFDVDLMNLGYGSKPSSTVFTPPISGMWDVRYTIVFSVNYYEGGRVALLYKNGVLADRHGYMATQGIYAIQGAVSGSDIIYFNGNSDYVSLAVFQNSGDDLTIGSDSVPNDYSSYITFRWLGY